MNRTREKGIKIFIASSGELKKERDIASRVVNEKVSKLFTHLKLEVVKWETDIPAGSYDKKRIQDEINPYLAECDIVMTLFYSKVGKFTLEEYLLAMQKKKKMFLYFKSGFSPKNKEEIESYAQVLLFKESLDKDNRALYREYAGVEEFAGLLSDDLNLHLSREYPVYLDETGGSGAVPKFLTPLPPRPVELIGREKAFAEVAKLLENSQQVLLVNGMGGVGKTELCKSYFWHKQDDYPHLAWVDFVGSIKESFINSFEMEAAGEETIDQRFARILALLKGPARQCLLVVDNMEAGAGTGAVEDLDLILSLPCRVLVSSRLKLEGFKCYDLDFLSPADCRELFLRFYEDGEEEKEAGEVKPPRPDDPELAEIIRLAGYHTLTVELLARTARNAARGILDFLRTLREKGFNLNETIPEQVETLWNRETGSKKFFDHLLKVFRLSGLSDREDYILTNLAILPPVYIEMEDISRWLELESKDGLNALVKKGWLRRSGNQVFLHQVMGEAVYHQAGPDCEKCKKLIVAMANNLSCEPGENRLHKKEFLPFAEAILTHVKEDNRDLAALVNNLSLLYQALGLFTKALGIQLRAVETYEKVLDKGDPDLAGFYNNAAVIYKNLGRLEKALEFQLKTIKIAETVMGEDDPRLATSYNNAATIYQDLGRLEDALEFLFKTIDIREKISDKDHPDLAASYNNLSQIYQNLGRLEEALEFQLKALEIREKVLDKDHPSLANSYHNLSIIYTEQEQLEEAENYARRAVAILEKLFPDGHPNLDLARNNLERIRAKTP